MFSIQIDFDDNEFNRKNETDQETRFFIFSKNKVAKEPSSPLTPPLLGHGQTS